MLTSTRATRMAKMPRRETQKQKVYDAENAAGLWGTAVGTTQVEVQAYVDKLTNYEWFRRRWGSQRFHVNTQNGAGGHGGWHNVTVGLNVTGVRGYEQGAQRNVVLHEMAHTLAQGKDGNGNWHGPHFARTMLELVRYAVGAEQAKTLRESYRKHKVKLAPPTPLRSAERTPAAREILSPKVWRVEFKRSGSSATGKTETRTYEAKTLKEAVSRFLETWGPTDAHNLTSLKVWKGVRVSAAKPKARAATRRPRAKAKAPHQGS